MEIASIKYLQICVSSRNTVCFSTDCCTPNSCQFSDICCSLPGTPLRGWRFWLRNIHTGWSLKVNPQRFGIATWMTRSEPCSRPLSTGLKSHLPLQTAIQKLMMKVIIHLLKIVLWTVDDPIGKSSSVDLAYILLSIFLLPINWKLIVILLIHWPCNGGCREGIFPNQWRQNLRLYIISRVFHIAEFCLVLAGWAVATLAIVVFNHFTLRGAGMNSSSWRTYSLLIRTICVPHTGQQIDCYFFNLQVLKWKA